MYALKKGSVSYGHDGACHRTVGTRPIAPYKYGAIASGTQCYFVWAYISAFISG